LPLLDSAFRNFIKINCIKYPVYRVFGRIVYGFDIGRVLIADLDKSARNHPPLVRHPKFALTGWAPSWSDAEVDKGPRDMISIIMGEKNNVGRPWGRARPDVDNNVLVVADLDAIPVDGMYVDKHAHVPVSRSAWFRYHTRERGPLAPCRRCQPSQRMDSSACTSGGSHLIARIGPA
jgi:hypothetical protein